jgi:hypothetical protein
MKQAKIASMRGSTPAAIKVADEIAKARASGDTQRINDILASGKLYDRGVTVDENGNPIAMQGYGDAIGQIEGTKKAYEQNAKNQSDLYFNPQIRQSEKDVDLSMNPLIAEATQSATASGKRKGEIDTELDERIAGLPQLEETVSKLSELGQKATYTYSGRAGDAIRNEIGGITGMIEPSEGAIARREYISLVDNQILPLLRQTFGAQFTVQEGQSLRDTLGNPNMPPEEKDAVLRSFIDQKKQTIQSMQRQLGYEVGVPQDALPTMGNPDPMNAPPATMGEIKQGTIEDGYVFLGGDPADPKRWKRVQ